MTDGGLMAVQVMVTLLTLTAIGYALSRRR